MSEIKTKNAAAMLKAILAEPGLFRECYEARKALTEDFVALFMSRHIRRVYLCGSGSVCNASFVLCLAIERLLNIEASWSCPAILNHHSGFNVGDNYLAEEMVLICPSETGRTKGPVEAARQAGRLGIASVCTVQSRNSILAKECTIVIEKCSGVEEALPSTKGHSVGIFILLLCILETARAIGTVTHAEYTAIDAQLKALPNSCRFIAEASLLWFQEHQCLVMNAPFYRIVGYGANYGTAMEGALKFVEAHKRLTMAYELEEFLHGPIGTIRPGDVVFLLCAESGPEHSRMLELYRTVKKITTNCILIGSVEGRSGAPIALPFSLSCGEFFNTLELLVPIQLLAYSIGDALGFDSTQGMNRKEKLAMQPGYANE